MTTSPPVPPHNVQPADDDIVARLKTDVAKTGYASEIMVAAKFAEAGWTPVDHVYYMDRDENKGREIDLVAFRQKHVETARKKIYFGVGLAVEVKRAMSKPWVIFSTERTSRDNPGELFDTVFARMHIQEIWFNDLFNTHPAIARPRFGRASYQAFLKRGKDGEHSPRKTSDDEAPEMVSTFGAFVSCMKATKEIANIYQQRDKAPLWEGDKKSYEIGIAHGLIVIDGGLYEATVDGAGAVTIEATTWVPYIFNFASKEYGYNKRLIDIVRLDSLPEYLSVYNEWIDERTTFCVDAIS
jgi:hypothetical protein